MILPKHMTLTTEELVREVRELEKWNPWRKESD
jgi:hypothetical protein